MFAVIARAEFSAAPVGEPGRPESGLPTAARVSERELRVWITFLAVAIVSPLCFNPSFRRMNRVCVCARVRDVVDEPPVPYACSESYKRSRPPSRSVLVLPSENILV